MPKLDQDQQLWKKNTGNVQKDRHGPHKHHHQTQNVAPNNKDGTSQKLYNMEWVIKKTSNKESDRLYCLKQKSTKCYQKKSRKN